MFYVTNRRTQTMQMSSDQYGQILGMHLCSDGFKWIITGDDQHEIRYGSPYHGYLFAPGGAILAHFYHESYMPVESKLRHILSYYRSGTDFATDTIEQNSLNTEQGELALERRYSS